MKSTLSSKKPNLLNKLILQLSPIHRLKIIGNSMSPVLQPGSEICINRLAYLFKNPKMEDIIALRDPRDGKILIKKINFIKDEKVFVIGINEKASTDSRNFGLIEMKSIIGKVLL